MRKLGLFVVASTLAMSGTAEAYIGPGAAAGTIAAVLGIIASIFLAFVAVLWYPVKRLLKRARPADASREAGQAQSRRADPADG